MYRPMFIPPRDNRLLIRAFSALLPAFSQLIGNLRDVQVDADDLSRLQALRDQRALLAPNHPTGDDPIVLFWLSRMLGKPFNYLAAREVLVGPRGWLLNRLGVYSVIRGVPDRESLRTTRRLLAVLDRKVVIFPEGEIYQHNDLLLSFQSGAVQLGFWALDDLERAGRTLDLPLLPIAIKYRCCDHARVAIESSLAALEQALRLPRDSRSTPYLRLRRIGDRVLAALEREEGLKPREGDNLSDRIPVVRRRIMERVAQAVGGELEDAQPPAEQLHALFNDVKSWVGLLPEEFSDYDERLYLRKMQTATPLFADLYRLQNFLVLTGDYVAANATAERFMEVLGRLEKEVFGTVRHTVPREALVRIAAPVRLEERYGEYRRNKRQVVGDITRQVEETIRAMLTELGRRATPISLES